MGLRGLGAADLAIAPTAALHCSTPTGMTVVFNNKHNNYFLEKVEGDVLFASRIKGVKQVRL